MIGTSGSRPARQAVPGAGHRARAAPPGATAHRSMSAMRRVRPVRAGQNGRDRRNAALQHGWLQGPVAMHRRWWRSPPFDLGTFSLPDQLGWTSRFSRFFSAPVRAARTVAGLSRPMASSS